MKAKWLAIEVSVLFALASCSLASDLTFDRQPDTVVLYADIQPRPGAPEPGEECRYDTVPRLRIWGDGLVFLNVSEEGKLGPALWSGKLRSDELNSVLSFLQRHGFLDDAWTPEMPNPAGTWLRMGVNLKTRSAVYTWSSFDPALYTDLVDMIVPHLTAFTVADMPDDRFNELSIGGRGCSTPSPSE